MYMYLNILFPINLQINTNLNLCVFVIIKHLECSKVIYFLRITGKVSNMEVES